MPVGKLLLPNRGLGGPEGGGMGTSLGLPIFLAGWVGRIDVWAMACARSEEAALRSTTASATRWMFFSSHDLPGHDGGRTGRRSAAYSLSHALSSCILRALDASSWTEMAGAAVPILSLEWQATSYNSLLLNRSKRRTGGIFTFTAAPSPAKQCRVTISARVCACNRSVCKNKM